MKKDINKKPNRDRNSKTKRKKRRMKAPKALVEEEVESEDLTEVGEAGEAMPLKEAANMTRNPRTLRNMPDTFDMV